VDSSDYFALVAALERARTELSRQPSVRALARVAKYTPTTIRKWMSEGRFPQDVEPMLRVVRAIRAEAVAKGLLTPEFDDVTDETAWKLAYEAEAKRRSGTTSSAMSGASARRGLANSRPGRPVGDCDPILLGIRPAIDPEGAMAGGLTRFVPRQHDRVVSERVARGGFVALVGKSSTGKSRSAWEAVRTLDDRWRLWQPGKWLELDLIGPYTVIWLNDAQRHLSEDHAERLAAVVSDAGRAPVTVLCTLWPEDWRSLTADATPGEPDLRSWARGLLAAAVIEVPDTFTPLDPDDLAAAIRDDNRWGRATREAGHQVIPYFAGVPALIDMYRHGPAMVRALIAAAMDARRLRMPEALLPDILIEAATGYPTEADWAGRDEQWPVTALTEASRPVRGLPGPLHPAGPRGRSVTAATHYTLAPYLEELGRTDRATAIPPESFWTAARQYLPPAEWAKLAHSADNRGLYRIGAGLRKAALSAGIAADPVELLRRVPGVDDEIVRWVVATVPATDLGGVQDLGEYLAERDAEDLLSELYRRVARTADLSAWDIELLLQGLVAVGDRAAADEFLARDPGNFLPLDDGLLEALAAMDRTAAARLARRIVAAAPQHPAGTIRRLNEAGFPDLVHELMAAMAPPTDANDLVGVLTALHGNGFDDEARRLVTRGRPRPERSWDAAAMMRLLDELGLHDEVSSVVDEINTDEHLRLRQRWRDDDLTGLPIRMRDRLILEDEPESADTVVRPKKSLRIFLTVREEAEHNANGLRGMSRRIAEDAAESVDLSDPAAMLALLVALRLDGHTKARDGLVARIDPARLTMREGWMCELALEVGIGPLSRAIMKRVVTRCHPFNNKFNRRIVIPALRDLGETDLLAQLAERIADAGDFDMLAALAPDRAARFPYGREPDRAPSPRWSWRDLG
jgi:hypothetical protein